MCARVTTAGNDGDDLLQEQVLPKNEDERLSNSTKSQFRELFKLSWPLVRDEGYSEADYSLTPVILLLI